MSYSFSVRAPSKADALEAVRAELEKVVAGQAIHERDREQALSAAAGAIELLTDDAARDVTASVSGYLSWEGGIGPAAAITQANVAVTATLVVRS